MPEAELIQWPGLQLLVRAKTQSQQLPHPAGAAAAAVVAMREGTAVCLPANQESRQCHVCLATYPTLLIILPSSVHVRMFACMC